MMTPADYARMSDPKKNVQFKRPWTGPPHEKESLGPLAGGTEAQGKTEITQQTKKISNTNRKPTQRRRPTAATIAAARKFLAPEIGR